MSVSGLLPHASDEALRLTDRARELFLSEPGADLSGVRPIIARSWYRSRAAGVDPVADRGFSEEGRVDEQTVRAAAPHLQKLDEFAEDVGGYVSLTAPNGVLVDSGCLRQQEEDFPPGYSLLESSCGSNGEGLALEEGRGVWLAPEEHFRQDMRGNWCFATLVRDPFHNRVRAVIGLTLPSRRVRGLEPSSTLLMLEGVAARIEREIEARASSRERALLNEYLTISRRRGNTVVIAMDGKNLLMNASATDILEEGDFSVVSGYAKAVMSSGQALSCDVTLKGTGRATLEASRVDADASGAGAIVVVRPHSPAQSHTDSEPARLAEADIEDRLSQRLDGASAEFRRTLTLARKAVGQRRSVIIVGEAGSGKRHLADTIASTRGNAVEFDALARSGNRPRFREVLTQAGPQAVLVVENADELSHLEASEIMAWQKAKGDVSVILTVTRPTDASLRIAEATGALEISIAPLRNRREDVPVLAEAIAAELGDRKLSRRLLATLTDCDWPRNVEQLRAVVSNAVESSRSIEVTVDDLPRGFQRVLAQGRLSRLEDAELSELRMALQEAKGNRSQAAEMLQIGRSTLYRRMDYFRGRGFDF